MRLLILFTFFVTLPAMDDYWYNCSSIPDIETIYYLQSDEPVFYDTTMYWSGIECFMCYMNFVFNGTNPENIFLYVANLEDDGEISFNKNLTSFSPPNCGTGFLIFEDWNHKCPLESISRINPFEFTDEYQVLHLVNYFDASTNTSVHPCKWRFLAPQNYGFKVSIEIFEADDFTELKIENRTDIILNERSVKLLHTLYNSDTYLQIYLVNHQPHLKFHAYISIVKNTFFKEEGDCNITHGENTITWQKLYYDNNQKCDFDIDISADTEVKVEFWTFVLEGSDFVGYNNDVDEFVMIKGGSLPQTFMLTPHKNGTTKRVHWKFESDGSIRKYGFIIIFTKIDCLCNTMEIPCDTPDNTIMNITGITDPKDKTFYCSNLQCNFVFEECDSNFTYVDLFSANNILTAINVADHLKIYSSDKMVYQLYFSDIGDKSYYVYLKSSNKNRLEIKTFYSNQQRFFSFSTLGYEIPPISNRVTLSFKNQSYIINAKLHDFTLIEMAKELASSNYTFEIHRYVDSVIRVYNNESFTYQSDEDCIAKMDSHQALHAGFYTCVISNHQSFVVYGPNGQYYKDYFASLRIFAKKTQVCIFNERTFYQEVLSIPDKDQIYGKDLVISVVANQNNPCPITLLSTEYVTRQKLYFVSYIKKVWTSSVNENVKIYIGPERNLLFFEYNSTSDDYWKHIVLSSHVYIIDIPKNSSALIVVSSIYTEIYDQITNINISSFPYYSVVATPNYKFMYAPIPFNKYFGTYTIGNVDVKFTATYISNDTNNDQVWLKINSYTQMALNRTGDFLIFNHSIVEFGKGFGRTDDNFDTSAIITIEALNNTI